jgi:hypothetical protein
MDDGRMKGTSNWMCVAHHCELQLCAEEWVRQTLAQIVKKSRKMEPVLVRVQLAARLSSLQQVLNLASGGGALATKSAAQVEC